MAPINSNTLKNGTLIKYRLDQLENWKSEAENHMTSSDTRNALLDKRITKQEADMEGLQEAIDKNTKEVAGYSNWLRGIFGSIVLALILLIVDLIRHTANGKLPGMQ